jgi:hypothetical protein
MRFPHQFFQTLLVIDAVDENAIRFFRFPVRQERKVMNAKNGVRFCAAA